MPTLRTRSENPVPPPISNPKPSNVSTYEQCREERIKENRLRLQNLLTLKSQIQPVQPVKRKYTQKSIPNPPLHLSRRSSRVKEEVPVARRSSRLKDTARVTYFEEGSGEKKKGKRGASKEVVLWLGEGERPEVYTEEQERSLGNTERVWELAVDGFENGKRVYDREEGETCHQCRQKTLGYHTKCSQSHPVVTGQFCGDCLYMRYGEHVLEAMENLDWICPVCRDICNCSLCRKAKGWLPTGNMYKKVFKLGYKSVAHYLIHRSKQSEISEDDETDEAKESSEEDDLPLEITDGIEDNDIEDILDDDDDDDDDETDDDAPSQASEEDDLSLEITDDEDDETNKNADSAGTSEENKTTGTDAHALGDVKPLDVNEMDPATPVTIDVDAEYEENRGTISKRKMPVKPNANSIGGRLRQRRKCQA